MNALSIYRMARWCYIHKIPLMPRVFQFLNTWLFSVKIPAYMHIGNGTKFAGGGYVSEYQCRKYRE